MLWHWEGHETECDGSWSAVLKVLLAKIDPQFNELHTNKHTMLIILKLVWHWLPAIPKRDRFFLAVLMVTQY